MRSSSSLISQKNVAIETAAAVLVVFVVVVVVVVVVPVAFNLELTCSK